jgi:DNA-binding SARP family transcriptional activator
MGWCHEFGCQITSGCNHPMQAGATACTCAVCDTVCTGRFSACPEVWGRSIEVAAPRARPESSRPLTSPLANDPLNMPAPPAAAASGSAPMPAVPANLMTRESGARILHWMRAEFDALRSQLQAVASGLAHQQALVSDLTGGQGKELNRALAELEGSSTQLRTEASRMRRDATGLQEDGAELRNEAAKLRDLERKMTERLPQVVAEAVQPELRAALLEIEAMTAGLREEAGTLRAEREGLAQQLPAIIEAAVLQALAAHGPVAPAPASAHTSAAASVPVAAAVAAPAAAVVPAAGGALADEPVEEEVGTFGPPPAPQEAPAAADGGVGDDPLACSLPGLVVGPSLAVAVSEALRRAGLRRRRRRRPAKPTPGLNRRDPFATDVTRRLDRYARARADLASVRRPAPANGEGPAAGTTVAAGFRDAEEVVVDLAEAGVVGLVGPLAADVARYVVTSFLALTSPGGGEALVVGDLLPPVRTFPGLTQPVDLASAIDQLSGAAGAPVDRAPGTTVVLVAQGASPEELARLADLRAGDAGTGLITVLVDGVPEDALTVRVDANERVTDLTGAGEVLAARMAGARLYTLSPEPAAELLGVLASARTDDEVVVAAGPATAEAFEVQIPEAPAVTVQLLGQYRIEVAGIEIRAGLRAKARELLAFYLLHPAGTTLDAAVEALWPEADPGRGSEWFWTALGNLRSRLRDATGEKKLKVIEREGDRYRVEPLFDVDLWRLEQAMSLGATEADDFGRAAAYDRVAATYTGDLLTGADWAWAETPREDLRQRVLDVLVWLGDVRWASGDARGSWQALQRAVEVDPYAEQIYRRIMRLQAKLGRPDDAAATFRRLQGRLVEIDLEPTPESAKLHAELTVP